MEHARSLNSEKPRLSRLRSWVGTLAFAGSAEMLVQAVGFLAGIIVIRLLSAGEYALYTLANTMLGAMAVLADAGVSAGVMAYGGKVWTDRTKLGTVIRTGLELRKRFAIIVLVLAAPALYVLLRRHEASWWLAALICVCMVPAFVASLSGAILAIAPKLHQQVAPLQKIAVVSNITRALLLAATLWVWPFAALAILCGGLVQLAANLKVRGLARGYADSMQCGDPVARSAILVMVRRSFPGAVYYCMASQLGLLLISIFGSTDALAEVGALSRVGLLANVLGSTFAMVLVPRFARLQAPPQMIARKYLLASIALLSLCCAIVVGAFVLAQPLLAILGPRFGELRIELVLVIAGSCIAMMAGILTSLASARGLVLTPKISIPVVVTFTTIGAVLLAPVTTRQAAVFSLYCSTVGVLTAFIGGLALIRGAGKDASL